MSPAAAVAAAACTVRAILTFVLGSDVRPASSQTKFATALMFLASKAHSVPVIAAEPETALA